MWNSLVNWRPLMITGILRTGSENPVLMNRHNRGPIMVLLVNLRLFHLFLVGHVGDKQATNYSGKTRMLN